MSTVIIDRYLSKELQLLYVDTRYSNLRWTECTLFHYVAQIKSFHSCHLIKNPQRHLT